MVYIYDNWRNLIEFNKFYFLDINRYRFFKLLKKIFVEIFILLYL